MEMSLDYMRSTAEHLAQHGYSLCSSTECLGVTPLGKTMSHRFELSRPGTELVLETVEAEGREPRYFMQLVEHHGLSSFSFPLDSWKHRPDRVEFKYYALPDDGRGLSFILALGEELQR